MNPQILSSPDLSTVRQQRSDWLAAMPGEAKLFRALAAGTPKERQLMGAREEPNHMVARDVDQEGGNTC
jgi:hypothetical protein